MPAAEPIQVLVCHDNPVLRAGLMVGLANQPGLSCIDGDLAALLHGSGATPDVIVADSGSGIRALVEGTYVPTAPRPRVLIVTHSDRECDIRAALTCGVHGYLLLEDAPEQLAPAVRAIRLGARILSPKVASRLAENVSLEHLTQREEDVLCLVVEGLCNKLVARRLGITVGTVKSHLRSAFGKLGVSSRTQATAIAQRRGLLNLDVAARAL